MPMVLLVISPEALEKVAHEAIVQDVKFDTLLSEQFNEFLVSKDFQPAPVAAPKAKSEAISVDSRNDLLNKILDTARGVKGKFVFSDVVALVPELAEMPKQETTTYASLFSRAVNGQDSGIVKVGKNASKTTEYEVQGA